MGNTLCTTYYILTLSDGSKSMFKAWIPRKSSKVDLEDGCEPKIMYVLLTGVSCWTRREGKTKGSGEWCKGGDAGRLENNDDGRLENDDPGDDGGDGSDECGDEAIVHCGGTGQFVGNDDVMQVLRITCLSISIITIFQLFLNFRVNTYIKRKNVGGVSGSIWLLAKPR